MNILAGISNWFTLAVPNPTDANRSVQLGVHFEEVTEMLEAIAPGSGQEVSEDSAFGGLLALANAFKSAPTTDPEFGSDFQEIVQDMNRQELLDSLCDQIVTAIGVAHMFGMDISGALTEVNASNFSKFKDGHPIWDTNGKIAKNPETFFKPDLSKFI